MRGGLRLEFGEAERDRRLDLVREVEVVPGDVGEQGVDEMQAAQIVAGGGSQGENADAPGRGKGDRGDA